MSGIYTPELETDLALVKMNAAQSYMRKRHLLRKAVDLKLFTVEEARTRKYEINELLHVWRQARTGLRNGCALLKAE